MTIIGIAPVPGITTLPLPLEVHPAWCVNATGALATCGDHFGEGINIAATAGDFHVVEDGALFPRIEVAAVTHDGALGVNVALFDPAGSEWAESHLKPAVARRCAAVLAAGRSIREPGINRSSMWIAVRDGEPVTVTVIDRERKVLVSARLHTHEVKKLADAIISAADLVDGQ